MLETLGSLVAAFIAADVGSAELILASSSLMAFWHAWPKGETGTKQGDAASARP